MHKDSVLGSITLLLLSPVAFTADNLGTPTEQVGNDADVAVTVAVKGALVESGIAKTGEVQVETHERVVQLSGFVDSESTQELALQAARAVNGVESVRNDLVVRTSKPTLTERKDDTVIAARVRKQLQQQTEVRSSNDINVDVSEGLVQLSGFVDSVDKKNRAADIVASVTGVKDVRNDIALER